MNTHADHLANIIKKQDAKMARQDRKAEEAARLAAAGRPAAPRGKRTAFLTAKDRKALPALYSQDGKGEDAIAFVKYFHPYGRGTWLAFEFDGEDLFFGAVNLGHGWELGYFSLAELEDLRGPGGVQGIERDRYFSPCAYAAARSE